MSSRPPLASASVDLLAQLAGAASSQESASALLTELAAQAGASRASLGWWAQGHITPAAQWGHPALGAAMTPASREAMTAAMEEAVDQGVSLTCPATALQQEADWVDVAQRGLAAQVHGAVACLPLPGGPAPLGAVCLEWPAEAGAPTTEVLASLETALAQASPVLALQRRAERPWRTRLRASAAHAWHRAWQRRRGLVVAGGASLACALLLPLPDRVGGQARLEGGEQRVLVAPADGYIKGTRVHPGDRVKAGQVLADLAEQDLRLERDRWASQVTQHESAYAAAMARADRAEAAVSLAKAQEAQAQLALIDDQLHRTQLVAPFDGLVVQGDLSQSIGAPVRQGDPLLTVASTSAYRVIVEIDEADVARVRVGQVGEVALSALPWDTLGLKVVRITPLAQARDGRNVFEVEARFVEAPPPDLRPGLSGQAHLTVGRAPGLWAAARPLADRLRFAWWRWWG